MLTQYFTAMARFHNYSFGNVMLIARQKPQATQVAGILKKGRKRHPHSCANDRPQEGFGSGSSMEETYLLAVRFRCRGGVNLVLAFVRNLRTWRAMARKKAQVDAPRG